MLSSYFALIALTLGNSQSSFSFCNLNTIAPDSLAKVWNSAKCENVNKLSSYFAS